MRLSDAEVWGLLGLLVIKCDPSETCNIGNSNVLDHRWVCSNQWEGQAILVRDRRSSKITKSLGVGSTSYKETQYRWPPSTRGTHRSCSWYRHCWLSLRGRGNYQIEFLWCSRHNHRDPSPQSGELSRPRDAASQNSYYYSNLYSWTQVGW